VLVGQHGHVEVAAGGLLGLLGILTGEGEQKAIPVTVPAVQTKGSRTLTEKSD